MYKHYEFYQQWSKSKLQFKSEKPSIVKLDDLTFLSSNDLYLINEQIKRFNYCIYEVEHCADDNCISLLAKNLGLESLDTHLCASEDRVTILRDKPSHKDAFYIPYTNKPINWHTDGYYNPANQIVYSFILHCAQSAFEGGVSGLIDQDQVFVYLMEQEPRYISALMDPNVMSIPENKQNGVLLRPQTSTAIFSVLNKQHDVLMRYSLRKKNINFKQDELTQEALACLDECIRSNESIHYLHKLKPGQGVISNNVLHKRTAFEDKIGQERLYYRARYYNRINI